MLTAPTHNRSTHNRNLLNSRLSITEIWESLGIGVGLTVEGISSRIRYEQTSDITNPIEIAIEICCPLAILSAINHITFHTDMNHRALTDMNHRAFIDIPRATVKATTADL